MKAILSEAHYFPNISYFAQLIDADVLVLDDTENFQKQTYRNRCEIMGANGILKLIVPMNHRSSREIKKIEVSDTERWQQIHIKSITSAYRRGPFYDYYAEEILNCLDTHTKSLFELNYAIMTCLVESIGLDVSLHLKSEFTVSPDELSDLSNHILAKKQDVNLDYPRYHQVFESGFTPNLSLLDLLFNLGPETLDYLIRIKEIAQRT